MCFVYGFLLETAVLSERIAEPFKTQFKPYKNSPTVGAIAVENRVDALYTCPP